MIFRHFKLITPISAVCTGLLNSGCTHDQVMRITYETLRQEDCHRTSFRTDYCDRSYAFEYVQYKQLRNSYLHEINNEPLALTDSNSFIFSD